jgi:hypothetical protein
MPAKGEIAQDHRLHIFSMLTPQCVGDALAASRPLRALFTRSMMH